MTWKIALTVSATGILAGCMPMEQASLIYSSSNTIGVDVEGGRQENPGLLVSIGYRGLNAAYVPVVAAKNCPEFNRENCHSEIYRPLPLAGSSRQGDTSSSRNESVDALAARIIKRAGDISARAEDLKQLRKKASDLKDIMDALEQNKQQPADPADWEEAFSEIAPSQEEAVATLEKKLADAGGSEAVDALDQEIATKQNELDQWEKDQAGDRGSLAQAREEAKSDNKDDAHSVFGSFNGATSGKSEGASLELGQIFSTGIAAQNLTQGLGNAALIERRLQCINVVAKRIDPKADFAQVVKDICTTGEEMLAKK